MYKVVTGTNKYGNCGGCVTYNEISLDAIAEDLAKRYRWDYAHVYGDSDLHVAKIIKIDGEPIVYWDWDEIC